MEFECDSTMNILTVRNEDGAELLYFFWST